MNLTEAHKAAAFEWLRYLPERHGNIDDRDREQADIALRVWNDAETRAQRAEAKNARLREALQGLLNVIADNELIPESVSYMQKAREALATPPPKSEPCDVCGGKGRRAFPNATNTMVHHPVCIACNGTGNAHPTPEQSRRQRASEIEKDEAAVDRFAEAMKEKLAKAREKGRGGWDDPDQCTGIYLASLLVEHLRKGNEGTFEDVANFAMMLHQRGEAPETLERAWLEADKAASDRGYRYAMKAAAPHTPEQTGDALAALERIEQGAAELRDTEAKAFCGPQPEDFAIVRQDLTASGVPYVPERQELSDDRIRDMLAENKMFRKGASISYTRWRDGIGVQMPTLEMTRFTRAVWNEALAAAPAVPEAMHEVLEELSKAREKFPQWPSDPIHASMVVQEEAGELAQASLQAIYEPHKHNIHHAYDEARQTAAMAIRFMESFHRYIQPQCPQHDDRAAAPQRGGE